MDKKTKSDKDGEEKKKPRPQPPSPTSRRLRIVTARAASADSRRTPSANFVLPRRVVLSSGGPISSGYRLVPIVGPGKQVVPAQVYVTGQGTFLPPVNAGQQPTILTLKGAENGPQPAYPVPATQFRPQEGQAVPAAHPQQIQIQQSPNQQQPAVALPQQIVVQLPPQFSHKTSLEASSSSYNHNNSHKLCMFSHNPPNKFKQDQQHNYSNNHSSSFNVLHNNFCCPNNNNSKIWLLLMPLRSLLRLDCLGRRSHFCNRRAFPAARSPCCATIEMFKIQKADGRAQLVKCAEDGGIERTYPLSERSLQNGFGTIEIRYCDNIVLHFMRRIGCFFTTGIFLDFGNSDDIEQWVETAKTIWPTIRNDIYALTGMTERPYKLLMKEISPAVLAECPKLRFVSTITVMPKRPEPSGPSSSLAAPTSGPSSPEGLYNWLHSPRTDGLPKFARCYTVMNAVKDINDISETFLTQTWPVSYAVAFFPAEKFRDSFEAFSEENGHTKERLTLARKSEKCWILQRGPAGSNWTYEAADKQWIEEGRGIKLNFSMDEEFEGCLAEEDDDDAMEGIDEHGDLEDEAEDVDMWESESNDADLPE